jgi:hypothetical protein
MKISGSLGLTVNMGQGEFSRPSFTITDIDIDNDINDQLNDPKVKDAFEKLRARLKQEVLKSAEDLSESGK